MQPVFLLSARHHQQPFIGGEQEVGREHHKQLGSGRRKKVGAQKEMERNKYSKGNGVKEHKQKFWI